MGKKKRPSPPPAPVKMTWRERIIKVGCFAAQSSWAALKNALIILPLVGGKLIFEQTEEGNDYEQVSHARASVYALNKDVYDIHHESDVVVVDITKLTQRERDGSKEQFTSRADLARLIEVIAKEAPRAIGVDVNLAPLKPGAAMHPEDEGFLTKCDQLRNEHGVAIIVGVDDRSQFGPPDQWLGSQAFSQMAASAMIPKDARLLPLEYVDSTKTRLGGFAADVFLAAGGSRPAATGNHWLETLARHSAPEPNADWSVLSYYVDYSWMRRPSIVTGYQPAIVEDAPWLFKDKFVLIGDVHGGSDKFNVRGVAKEPVAGVVIHACGVDTLVRGEVAHLTHHARLILDVLVAGAVILLILLLRICYFLPTCEDTMDSHATHWVFTFVAVALVISIAHVMAWKYRIVWTDAIMVAAALLLHRPIEILVHAVFRSLRHHTHKNNSYDQATH